MATVISRKYEVIGQLGQGGMGVVYKVRHNALDTILALKVLPPELMENPEMITRFYREARVVACMSHPNIVRMLDIERDESLNFHYFVMEYIQGQTFSQFLRERGPLPLIDVLDISRQVARALAYAHNHTPPIIHRDIKPSNIMIEDRSARVVVMDFGIAKELGDGERTKSGAVMGTLKYCSPEQMRREPLDGSADIYSLGLVMYEAYTGTQFFAGLDETEVIGKVLYDEREHEPQFMRPTPPAFVDLVTKAIAKSRARRYWRIEDFLHDLEVCWSTLEGGEKDLFPTASLRQDKTRIENPPEELHEIEEQIRRLEEERQKRLILPLQIQAREARERAAREATQASERLAAQRARQGVEEAHAAAERSAKGGQYAEAFAQARQLVEQGRQCEKQEQFTAARERYTQATDHFAQLAQEAEHAALSVQVADNEQTVILARQIEVDVSPAATPTNPSVRSWSRTPTVLVVALSVLLGLYVSGVFHRSAESPALGPSQPLVSRAATGETATPAVAEPQQPAVVSESSPRTSNENGPLAMIPPASPPTADSPRFSSVARIAAYTEVPTAKVTITVSPASRAVLGDQEVAVSTDGSVQVTLQNLPPGESQHVLRLMDASGAQSQDVPIRVMYYPGWEIRVYAGHHHEAYLVAFSPDGMQAISSSRDKTIKLWDVETGQETGSFVGHTDGVFAVAFSPDGKRIISGSDDKTLRLWDVATGQCVRTFVGHKDWINSVAFSPDGTRVVSGSKDRTVKVWNVETGREIRTFAGRMDWVFAVAFAPDGKRIIAGGADNRLRLWDLETGREIRTLTGHTDWITAVAFAPDGQQVISASHDETLRLWDLKTGRTMQTFVGHEAWVNGVAFAPDGTRVASASKDKTLKLWDLRTGQELRTFSGHSGPVVGVAFTPDGQRLLSGSYDKTLKLWWAGIEPTEITMLPPAGPGQ